MSSNSRPGRPALGMVLLLVLWACTASESLLGGGLEPPAAVSATPLNLSAVRVEWQIPAGGDLQLFRVERRSNFTGRFQEVAEVPASQSVYFDTGLEPATFYGYRVVTISRVGEVSAPSVVAGAQTPPLPGIRLETSLAQTDAGLADPNGYQVRLSGPKDTTIAVGSVGTRVVAPLPVGTYTVSITDVASTCTILNGSSRTVTLADTGLVTQQPAVFSATCADPTRGTIVARIEVTGDSVDADGYRLDYAGIITGDPVPVTGGAPVTGAGQAVSFGNLRPGDYEVSLGDVEAPCALTGPASRNAQVQGLSLDTLVFTVGCPTKGGGNPAAPFILRNVWSPQQAGTGQTVTLDISLDLSADPAQDVGAVQASLQYDPAVLTFAGSASPSAAFGNLTVNSSTPGTIGWLNFSTAATAPKGIVPVARFTFTVTGNTGQAAATRSAIQTIADFLGAETLEGDFRVVEDTVTVGSGGGGNQSPTAEAGGPYAGAVGTPIDFSSAGSADPDGSITSYSWSFGNGSTSSQPNPTVSYASAGTYTVTLTVTDNQGATASDQATVTVTVGSGNQPPTAQAGGPYAGLAGSTIGFSSSGSADPDGSIASYLWSFGDGTTSTQANPSKSYAAAGSYTATLTVTDNLGATASDQAAVTVTAALGPVSWASTFGPFEPVLGTYPLLVSLDLTTDIPQTSGPEALQGYAVDSLVWDPAVLEYHSLTYASGGGSVNPTDATGGCRCKLIFTGIGLSPNTGKVAIATVRFKPKGAPGATTTPRFHLGTVLSTPALGSFNYVGVLQRIEGAITLP